MGYSLWSQKQLDTTEHAHEQTHWPEEREFGERKLTGLLSVYTCENRPEICTFHYV